MSDETPFQPSRRVGMAPPSYRQPRPGLDTATRTLLIAAGGVVALLLILVGVWAFSGGHAGAGGVPVIKADAQPWRVKPAHPGGMTVIGANDQMLNAPNAQTDTTAPTPEAPAPAALEAQTRREAREERTGVSAPPQSPAPAVAPATPAPEAPAPPPAAPPPQASAPPAPAAKGGVLVQLAALGTEASAQAEWRRLDAKMPDLLSGKQPLYHRIEHDGHTLWRLRLGGFASIADASHFCAQIRAKGGACQLANF